MKTIRDKKTRELYIAACIDGPNSLFSHLDDNSKSLLRQTATCKGYKKGEHLYDEGSLPPGLTCLVAGKVKITKKGVARREQIVRMAKPVGFIGHRAFFAGESHIASAEAIEDSITCVMKTDLVFGIVRSNSDFAMNIIRALATDLGFSNRRTVTLTQKHIRGRIAESLLVLRETYGCERDEATLKVYLSREDIANLSNMTTSNAIRTLSQFASEKVVALRGKAITVLDWDLLEHISHLG
ncbi:MAG: Crp/Fnr family transcriptional regulator [Odoribacteraceae bacterium]|jgi:CRP-like cAMP-binding protein|nr:Crp/Fnr family transcriptional regulator [Odoribacteraceae bacterium]